MLFGAMATTILINDWMEILGNFNDFSKPYEENEKLNIFFGTMKRFNEDQRLPSQLEVRIEKYLQYRWSNDKNLALMTNSDLQLLDQLPARLQTQLYVQYLHSNLVSKYSKILRITSSQFHFKKGRTAYGRVGTLIMNSHSDLTNLLGSALLDKFVVTFLKSLEPMELFDMQNLIT